MNQYQVTEELRSIIANNMQYTTWTVSTPHLVALVKKCMEAEREECAKLAKYWSGDVAEAIAVAIRARGEKK